MLLVGSLIILAHEPFHSVQSCSRRWSFAEQSALKFAVRESQPNIAECLSPHCRPTGSSILSTDFFSTTRSLILNFGTVCSASFVLFRNNTFAHDNAHSLSGTILTDTIEKIWIINRFDSKVSASD